MAPPTTTAKQPGKIRTAVFIGLIVVSVCTILVILYGFRLQQAAYQYRPPNSNKWKRPKHHQHVQDDNNNNNAGGSSDVADDEIVELSPEDLSQFSDAINSMKQTLKEIRTPMAKKRMDPILEKHPNHRLIFHDLHAKDREHSIFVSVTSYHDTSCKQTVRAIFDSAKDEQSKYRIFIGAVQVSSPLPKHTTTMEPIKGVPQPPLATEPLPEHSFDSCLGDSHLTDCAEIPFCPSDNVKIREVPKDKWQGHSHARYISLSMYRSESYIMFLDRRATRFVHDWHNILENEWLAASIALNNQRIVLSLNLPRISSSASSSHSNSNSSNQESSSSSTSFSPRLPICSASGTISDDGKLPSLFSEKSSEQQQHSADNFITTHFASSSFLFGPSSVLIEKVTDGKPWVSEVARDWFLSTALYVAGFDVVVPKTVIAAIDSSVNLVNNESIAEAREKSAVSEGEKYVRAVVEGRGDRLPTPERKKYGRSQSEFSNIAHEAMAGKSQCQEVKQ